jgi:hypothetical protein
MRTILATLIGQIAHTVRAFWLTTAVVHQQNSGIQFQLHKWMQNSTAELV